MRRYADRLIQTLMDYVGDLNTQPREIMLEEQAFLMTAIECRVFDASAKPQHVVEPSWYGISFADVTDSKAPVVPIRRVFVGDSFIIQGPAGPCIVRRAKKP